jgi:hypothetical protein
MKQLRSAFATTWFGWIVLVLAAAMATAGHYRHPATASGTGNLTIQIWSQDITTDGATATVRHASKIAEFKADGTWDEATDLNDFQKQAIANRLHVMLNNWVYGQGLEMPKQ